MSKVKILLYCTKGKPNLYKPYEYDCFEQDEASRFYLANEPILEVDDLLNGKIVAECECDKVEEIHILIEKEFGKEIKYYIYDKELENFYREDCVEKETCLKCNEISNYLNKGRGYFLHLSNVKVFDKPKELVEYDVKRRTYQVIGGDIIRSITDSCTNAPQNMCNVYDNQDNHYVLISIQPQHLVNILNGRKTIEIRKSILNALKELM